MKKTLSVIILIMATGLVFAAEPKSEVKKDQTFSGRVIFTGKNFIEVKRNREEKIFYFSDESKILKKDMTEAGIDAVELCQTVRIFFRKQEMKYLIVKLEIKKESNCR